MQSEFKLLLKSEDVFQILDALESRAESWNNTHQYLNSEEFSDEEFFIAEDCSDPEEARQIAGRFEEIINTIRKQIEPQEANT